MKRCVMNRTSGRVSGIERRLSISTGNGSYHSPMKCTARGLLGFRILYFRSETGFGL
jgi:hypothetical protein